MWLDSGKSTNDVFKLLKLDQDVINYSFRDKIVLSTWVSYLDLFITKHPDNTVALFLAVEAHLKDRPLNEFLNMIKKFSSMESFATTIQKNKIPSYLVRNESPRNVFTLLSLADEGDDILGTLFKMWMKYVKDFNKRNPRKRRSSSIASKHARFELQGTLSICGNHSKYRPCRSRLTGHGLWIPNTG
ncbi:Avirulence (Avh) protein [Phytophthora megakarya]|uniref:Avirulence (Avh) protein n=1 Tax=Phytophthora megakarya TaxID=4795 RepID=A0A225WSV7_9STRA|nr:Avirulence (Avh) protein [Phytophthora megakarya]